MVTYNSTPNNNWNPTVTVTYPRTGGRISAPLSTLPRPLSDNHINYKGTTYEVLPEKIKRAGSLNMDTPYYVDAPGTSSDKKIFTVVNSWGLHGGSLSASGSICDLDGTNKSGRLLAVSKLRKLRQVKLPKPTVTPKYDGNKFPVGAKVLINKPGSVHHGWIGTVTDSRITYSSNNLIYYVTFENKAIRSYYHEYLREAPATQAVSSLKELQRDIHETNIKNGFTSLSRSPGDLIALMHSELSEALEEYRNNIDVTRIYFNEGKPTKPEGFMVELADCVIRILDCAEYYGVDLMKVIEQKHAFNKTRSYRHGNKNL